MKESKLIAAPPMLLVEAAQWGASFGLRIFPLAPKDKIPLRGFKWRTDATKDPAKIAALWTKYPDANIAWCTGDDSDCFAIDIDGDEGERQFDTLQSELGRLPDTVTVLTPGKKDKGPGRHLLFKYPENEIKGRNGLVTNIDIKSDGGYCVLPPSVHPDGTGTYCFAAGKAFGEIEVAECPQVWLDFIRDNKQKKSSPTPSARPIVAINDEILERRVIAYLAKVPGAVKGNCGHNTLLSVAEALVNGFSLDPNAASAIAWEHFNSKCDPPWNESQRADFDRKFFEAENKPTGKGRGYLLDAERKCEHVELPAFIDSTPAKDMKEVSTKVKAKRPYVIASEFYKDFSKSILTGDPPPVWSIDPDEESCLNLFELRPNCVTVFGGDPGIGKTAFFMSGGLQCVDAQS